MIDDMALSMLEFLFPTLRVTGQLSEINLAILGLITKVTIPLQ